MSGPRTLTARWVFPVSGPPLERGTVTVRGDSFEAVEPHGTRTPDEDLGNVALIPGLVNAHTHLDLSGARGLIPPTDPDHFTDWLRGVIAYRRTRTPEQTQEDIREGLAECLRAGTTLIGDIAAEGQSWDALAAAPTGAVVFREFIGLTADRARQEWSALSKWADATPDTATCRAAVSPHAPYSVRMDFFRSLAWNGWAMTAHLAESPAEMELIATKSGPFEVFLRDLGIWEPGWITPSVDWLLWRTRRSPCVLFAHGNYLSPDVEIWANQSIVYCPRTHAAFRHPPHPFREFLARGVRVCLGTDSLASNPDLDIFAEARFVQQRYPDFPGDALLRMVTLSGAEALGWADEAGSLEPGKSADLVALPLPDRDAADPHELLFSTDGERRTMFRGEWR
ncbi:MAG TPA: amidohydrolase family protein [Fimbriiglobus sp.]|nr:amidohydrolase family protein [Fimbriiglobus sp.]